MKSNDHYNLERMITFDLFGSELILPEYTPMSVTYYPETDITVERAPMYGDNDYMLLLRRGDTYLYFLGLDSEENGVYDVTIHALENRDEFVLAGYKAHMGYLNHITGNGTIGSLRLAQDFLIHHFIGICREHNARCIEVHAIDPKRLRVYSRLKKYGFKQFEDCPALLIYPFADDVVDGSTINPPEPEINLSVANNNKDPFASPF